MIRSWPETSKRSVAQGISGSSALNVDCLAPRR